MAYFSEILEAAARNGLDGKRLVGEHSTDFKANDLLVAGSWNQVVALISTSVFRLLEGERSSRKLVKKMSLKLDLGVDSTKIANAIPYFEIRHLLVHSDGIASASFVKEFPGFGEIAGKKINLTDLRVQRARNAVTDLIKDFDNKVLSKNVIGSVDIQPRPPRVPKPTVQVRSVWRLRRSATISLIQCYRAG